VTPTDVAADIVKVQELVLASQPPPDQSTPPTRLLSEIVTAEPSGTVSLRLQSAVQERGGDPSTLMLTVPP
jgi:hypothetical protein